MFTHIDKLEAFVFNSSCHLFSQIEESANTNFQNSQAKVGMIIFHISDLIKQCLMLTYLDLSHPYSAKAKDTWRCSLH